MLNMGAVKGFDLFLDDPLEVYHVGETLRGHVILTLTKDLAMKGIRVAVKGEIRTQWRERHNSSGSGKRGSSYRGGEQLFCERKTVWGNEPEDKTEIPLLTAGSYSFPFQFQLPSKPGLPCSFECGNMAYVRYLVHANMDIAWAVHPVAERYFSFTGSEIDCNLPKYQKPVHASHRKTLLNCCCRSSGPIALKAEMQRSAYCSGEFVNIKTRLENNSDKVMRLGVKLLQNVTFIAEMPRRVTKTSSYEIMAYSSPCVLPNQEYCLQTARVMQIPIVPCSIETRHIVTRYTIEIYLIVGEKPELNINFPVTIANVPMKDSRGNYRDLNYGHACAQSCGANGGTVNYQEKERVIQLKHFTPLYLTASTALYASQDRSASQRKNGTAHNGPSTSAEGNGSLANGDSRNHHHHHHHHHHHQHHKTIGHLSTREPSNWHSFSSSLSHDLDGNDDFDASVIASKSSGSVTKYSMRTTRASGILSRKPSKEEQEDFGSPGPNMFHRNHGMFLISGNEVDFHSADNPGDFMELDLETGRIQFDIGDDGQVYECHYV